MTSVNGTGAGSRTMAKGGVGPAPSGAAPTGTEGAVKVFQVRIHGRGRQGVVSGAELLSVAEVHERFAHAIAETNVAAAVEAHDIVSRSREAAHA